MTSLVALLRGINVGGQRKVSMNDLKHLFESLGLKNVRTYIQSGNVVFDVDDADPDYLSNSIEEKILADLSLQVSVIIRNHAALQSVLENNPFLNEPSIIKESLFVTFLSDRPGNIVLEKISAFNYSPDEFKIIGPEIYVYCPNGYGKTKLNNTFFENKLKLKATSRNWRTINVLCEMTDSK